MENSSFPPGFRFVPTDEELVKFYLTPKIKNLRLPSDHIIEVELYKFSPQQLSDAYDKGEEAMYFFSPRERKYRRGTRPDRFAGDGFWKATGADIMVRERGTDKLIGYKKVLTYYERSHDGDQPPKKTNWIMYEYRIYKQGAIPVKANGTNHALTKLDHWVLCRLHKRCSKKEEKSETKAIVAHDMKEETLRPIEEQIFSQNPILNNQYPLASQAPEFATDFFTGPEFESQYFPQQFHVETFDQKFEPLIKPEFYDVGSTSSSHQLAPLPMSIFPPDRNITNCFNNSNAFSSDFVTSFSEDNNNFCWNGMTLPNGYDDLGMFGCFKDGRFDPGKNI